MTIICRYGSRGMSMNEQWDESGIQEIPHLFVCRNFLSSHRWCDGEVKSQWKSKKQEFCYSNQIDNGQVLWVLWLIKATI